MIHIAHLESRALLRLHGSEVVSFLQNLITCEVESLGVDGAGFGALLTPQGKILFDFFVLREEQGFLLDVEKDQRAELAKRLTFYKLRADVSIENLEDKIFASWGEESLPGTTDPRTPSLGARSFGEEFTANCDEADWNAMRIKQAMPQSGLDFALESAFPHEVLMDQFGGVDFIKGCYVGQEVVSRMQHRGNVRKRVVCVSAHNGEALPEFGNDIVAGERSLGNMGSSLGDTGLAIIRLDRMAKALSDNVPITSAGVALTFSRPEYASYEWPV